jgi:hypothetical protein
VTVGVGVSGRVHVGVAVMTGFVCVGVIVGLGVGVNSDFTSVKKELEFKLLILSIVSVGSKRGFANEITGYMLGGNLILSLRSLVNRVINLSLILCSTCNVRQWFVSLILNARISGTILSLLSI